MIKMKRVNKLFLCIMLGLILVQLSSAASANTDRPNQKVELKVSSKEDADTKMKKVISALPDEIILIKSADISEKEFLEIYRRLKLDELSVISGRFDTDPWFLPYIEGNCVNITYNCKEDKMLSIKERCIWNDTYNNLHKKYENNEISTFDFLYAVDVSKAKVLGKKAEIKVSFKYSDAWKLACRVGEDEVVEEAEKFYAETLTGNDKATTAQIIERAQDSIIKNCTYDYAEEGKIKYGLEGSNSLSHSIKGFLKNKKIVCDGYAETFQYLMLKSGIPCVIMEGSINEKTDEVNHVWNKVKVNGKWYNVDVCWADTGWSNRLLLKSDSTYMRARHSFMMEPSGRMKADEDYM